MEEERVAIIGIFVRDTAAAGEVNSLLHEFGDCIIGRMGVPYREKSINIISIIVCAPSGRISALSGRLGRIKGITARAMQVSLKQAFEKELCAGASQSPPQTGA